MKAPANNYFRYLFEISDYDECLNIIQIACTASSDHTSKTYAHLLNTRATAYYELNRLGLSRQAIETALSIRQQILPENHLEIAISLANLGNVEAAEGNLDGALVLFKQVAAICEHIGDPAATMLGLNYLQLGRVFFQKGDYKEAYELYQRSEGIFNKRVGRDRNYTANLHHAYGDLEFAKGNYVGAARAYELCRRISMDYNPLHPLTSAACYKLACAEFEQNRHKKALNLLEKALEIADIRSCGIVDGTCARILWKRAQVLLDEPLATRRDEGHKLMTEVELKQTEIAEKLSIDLRLEELQEGEDKEKTFDLLVPYYFR
jgi:tetratricopeptide (TPR) repeat protein